MTSGIFWPLQGLVWFLARPRLWWSPLVAQMAVLTVALAAGVAAALACWPAEGATGWAKWQGILLASGAAPAAAGLVWMVVAPVATALVLDSLVIAVRREQGLSVDDGGLRSLPAALVLVTRTLPARLGWLALGLISLVLGPFGAFTAAYAMARTAALDAFDTALATEDVSASHRWAGLQAHQQDRVLGAIPAAGLHLLLAATFIAWWCWMPALVCGAALRRSRP